MREAELKQQSKDVRDEFERIKNSEIDGDTQIAAWETELESNIEQLRLANEQHDRVRAVLGSLQSQIDEARETIEQLDGQRAESIATALIEGDRLDSDDELLARRLTFEHLIERLTLARPALERHQRSRYRALDLANSPCVVLREKISQRRDDLKLQLARRRHGYA